MTCKWLNTLGNKIADKCRNIGTVTAIIQNPHGFTESHTSMSLEELVKSLEGTGCTVVSYNGKLVKIEEKESNNESNDIIA